MRFSWKRWRRVPPVMAVVIAATSGAVVVHQPLADALISARPAAQISHSGPIHRGAARTPTDPSIGAAASRTVWWTNCGSVVALSDADLDLWASRGVGGFVCMVPRLAGMGGDQQFTGNPGAALSGTSFTLQRRIRDSGIVDRAARRGMKLYLGFYLVNYFNTSTPLATWFDDAGWQQINRRLADAAGAARLLGMAGLAFDHELYPQTGNARTATWRWDHPGNDATERAVRNAVVRRGKQMMTAMVGAFPGLEVASYAAYFPEAWEELVQEKINKIPSARAREVTVDLWNGLTSVDGYGPVRFYNAIFYKTPHLPGSTWESALSYDASRTLAMFSRSFENWDYAWSRISVTPFAWVNAGKEPFEAARSPEHVSAQLSAFRRWGMDGEFANYAYGGLAGFDYRPYEDALRAAARPGVVDSQPPKLHTSDVQTGATHLSGTASDDMAVRSVTWRTEAGATGVAEMTTHLRSGDAVRGGAWSVRWTAHGLPYHSGRNLITVTVTDIKGNGQTTVVVVDR